MNNQQKINRLKDENFIKQHNLIKEDITKLLQKYNVYAYDIVIAALMNPSQLTDNKEKKFHYSNQAIHYFALHDLSFEKISEITKHSLSEIKATLEKIEPKEETGYTPLETTPAPFQTPTPNEFIQKMTLEDYLKHLKPEDKPAPNYQALEDAAWEDFGIGEGLIPDLYFDYLGHATIGNGHLVLHKDHLYNEKKLTAYKKSYIKLPLIDKDNKELTIEEKENQFEILLENMRHGSFLTEHIPYAGRRIKSPEFGKLNEAGMRQVFNEDFKFHYDRVKYDRYNKRMMFPNFEKFPLPVQLEVLHTLYAGQISALYKKTKGNNNNLAVIHQAVFDTRTPIASYGEKNTIQKAGKCLEYAEQAYVVLALQNFMDKSQDLAQKQNNAGRISAPRIKKDQNTLG